MFVISTTLNTKECSVTKSDSNWVVVIGLKKLDYWCWLVIDIIPLHWLFIQI